MAAASILCAAIAISAPPATATNAAKHGPIVDAFGFTPGRARATAADEASALEWERAPLRRNVGPARNAAAAFRRTPAADREPFDGWLDGVRADALARGIREATVDRAFEDVRPLEIVVKRDRAQAEFTVTLDRYVSRRLAGSYVRDVRAAYAKHRSLLKRVSARYGVPPAMIMAVWALESNLGRFSGVRPTIATLATLAWDGRREEFFRNELLAALTILDRGDIELARLKGSWAGAMGQPQFMPTSYLRYAQDFDGDGRRDIWRTPADVFASIAYYLAENGWTPGQRWGREVRMPDAVRAVITSHAPLRTEGCRAEREMTVDAPLAQWRDWGLTRADGGRLPDAAFEAALLDAPPRAFLLYPNYEALLDYNCAHAYALAVGLLADRLDSPPSKSERAAARKRKSSRRTPRTKTKAPTRRR